MRQQAMIRASAALRASNDPEAAQILEDDLLIDSCCKHCRITLESQFEIVALQDSCENCWLVDGIHPAVLKKSLLKTWQLHQASLVE